MKIWKSLLIVLMIFANLAFAQPSFADRPKFSENPDYVEVTKAIKQLTQAKKAKNQLVGVTPGEIQQKIDELEFQKYALETGSSWGQCENYTGNTIAVYGKPANEELDDDAAYENGLYFLADGQSTQNNWDCDGFYLPNDAKLAAFTPDGKTQELTQPTAIKIPDGSKLTIKSNPDTGALEINIPNAQIVTANDVNWFIPNVAQALIDTRVPNAPTQES
ncbi:MAG: hypothetical protein RMX96_00805 [Nostoc sp. ChiSLP02]|nr:hypothetical protein [Nostoc sp. DedSLP05]MDZ8103054.1 hypothetical protein [Nostoc sp. DedSLP01]MDZ8183389.1 hypothetical protein [Nostoc sp. ChiSLP02]